MTNQEKQPILVKNPLNNRFYDIAPFFYFIEAFANDPVNISNELEEKIRLILLNFSRDDGDMGDLKEITYLLFQLKDMFKETSMLNKMN